MSDIFVMLRDSTNGCAVGLHRIRWYKRVGYNEAEQIQFDETSDDAMQTLCYEYFINTVFENDLEFQPAMVSGRPIIIWGAWSELIKKICSEHL